MEAICNHLIYNGSATQLVNEASYKQWLKCNFGKYTTGLENVQHSTDKVSAGFVAQVNLTPINKPFVVLYYRGGNLNSKHVIKEFYADWEAALNRYLQLQECGYSSLKHNAA